MPRGGRYAFLSSDQPVHPGKRLGRLINEAGEALDWLDGTVRLCETRECALSLDTLTKVGFKHLVAFETCANYVATNGCLKPTCAGGSEIPWEKLISAPTLAQLKRLMDQGEAMIVPLRQWIGRWRAAAAEAETLGLGRDISYKYWQKNVELPEVVIRAIKWFDTAERLAQAVDVSRLMKFATDGRRHIEAVRACLSIPKFRRWSIQRSFVKWSLLVVRWVDQAQQAEGPESPDDSTTLEIITLYERMKMERRAKKADRLKKRTCSHCGKKAPLSQLSFAYCGGCRHSGVAREHWTRYCSEACQSAHWAAGHKDECPCAKDL